MKYLAMLVLGLFIGVLAAVAGISALRQGTPYNDAVMTVMAQQMGAFKSMRESGTCDAPEIIRRLAVMDGMAGEVDAAFLPVGDDAKFMQLSSDLRNAVAKGSATIQDMAQSRRTTATSGNSIDCAQFAEVTSSIGGTCKGCHDIFR